MATCCLLRSAQGGALTRALAGQLLKRNGPLGMVAQPKKSLQLTAVCAGREYGPAAPGGHAKTGHWKLERALSMALLPIIPAAIIYPNPVLDTALTLTVMLHTHWGLQGVVTDYVHGPVLPKVLRSAVLVFSVLAFGGLCYLNYSDCGVSNAIRLVYGQL